MRYRDRVTGEIRTYRQLKDYLRHVSLPQENLFTTDTADFIGHDQIVETPPPEFDDTAQRAVFEVRFRDGRWEQAWHLEFSE